MSKLSRSFLKLFGQDGSSSNFGQFGSKTAGAPVTTKDLPTIQALGAWLAGLQNAIYSATKAPFLEDMNSLFYVMCYQLVYGLQEGIAEWNTETTYYIGSIVKKTGTSEFYKSLTDSNVGNTLPSKADNANWQYIINKGILQYDSTYSYSIGEITQKVGTAELYKSLTNSNVGNALPNQVTNANWQYLVDLTNLTPPPPGVQSIKFGFAALSISSSSSTSVSVSKNPQGDFGFSADMVVYAIPILWHTNFNINTGSPSAFSFAYTAQASLSGSGVDGSGGFLNGGLPGTTYTFTLNMSVSTNIGTGINQVNGTVFFIGVKQ